MHTLRNKLLFYGAAAGTGLVSLGLHRYMMEHYLDDRGLLIAGNLPGTLLLAVGIAFAALMVLLAARLGGDGAYADGFPRDLLSGGLLLAAGALMVLAVPGLDREPSAMSPEPALMGAILAQVWALMGAILAQVWALLPWLAAGSMAVLGIHRILGRKPWPVFSGLICLFYMMMLISNYRRWSADPQLQDYAYQFLAGVLLMLCAFHRTCCDAEIIQRKKLILTGLAAAVCCVAALSMPFQQGFYLASAFWGAGCICDVSVFPPDPQEEEAPQAPEAEE